MRHMQRQVPGGLWTALVALLVCLAVSAQDRGFSPDGAGATTESAPKRRALCIGIDKYPAGMGYGPLEFAGADARAMAETFVGLGYETTVMVDDAAQQDPSLVPTYENIRSQLKAITRASTNPQDTLIIFFAGHGDQISGQSVFIPQDYAVEEDYLTIGELFDAVNHPRCRAGKKLLILDACRSSGRDEGRMLSGDFLKSFAGVESLVVLSGCGVNQRSYEDKEIGHGRLTSVLMAGLRGAAFVEDREFLFGHELFAYTSTAFGEHEWLDSQTPVMFGKWDAKVRFDVAWRSLPDPPPITDADAEVFDMTMQMARTKANAADYTAGVKYATTALRIFERHPDALAWRAWCHYQLGNSEPAFRDAQLAIERDSTHPLAHYVRGALAFGRDDYAVAAADMRVAAAGADLESMRPYMDGEMVGRLHFRLAYSLVETRAPADECLAIYQRVLDNTSAPVWERTATYINMGAVFADMKHDPAAAIANYSLLIAMQDPPDDLYALALNNRASCRERIGEVQAAMADYDLVISTSSVPPDQRLLAIVARACLRAKHGAGRIAYRELAAALNEDGLTREQRANIIFGRGFVLDMMERRSRAIEEYTEALELRDAMPSGLLIVTLLNRAGNYIATGDYDAAEADLEELLAMPSLPPSHRAQAHNKRAEVYDSRNDLPKAIAEFESVIALEGVDPGEQLVAYANRGWATYRLTGDIDAFEADTKKALTINAGINMLHYNIGFIQMLRHDWPGATANYQKAVELQVAVKDGVPSIEKEAAKDGAPPEYTVYIGWQYTLMDREADGRALLQAYLTDHPTGPLAAFAKEQLATPTP